MRSSKVRRLAEPTAALLDPLRHPGDHLFDRDRLGVEEFAAARGITQTAPSRSPPLREPARCPSACQIHVATSRTETVRGSCQVQIRTAAMRTVLRTSVERRSLHHVARSRWRVPWQGHDGLARVDLLGDVAEHAVAQVDCVIQSQDREGRPVAVAEVFEDTLARQGGLRVLADRALSGPSRPGRHSSPE